MCGQATMRDVSYPGGGGGLTVPYPSAGSLPRPAQSNSKRASEKTLYRAHRRSVIETELDLPRILLLLLVTIVAHLAAPDTAPVHLQQLVEDLHVDDELGTVALLFSIKRDRQKLGNIG
jgi:hypothetical protein